MANTVINTAITFIVSTILGYALSLIKNYQKEMEKEKNNENIQNQALLMLIQNMLTNTYFVYNEMGKIPDYIYKNWNNLLKIYEKLGGNDYCHTLKAKMDTWEIVKTDILK